jgi:predicted dehydrogenase
MQNIILTGFGFMGIMHAQVYSQLKNARLAAVVDNNRAATIRTMKKLGVKAPLFATLDEALAAVPAQVVDICLPTDLHLPVALRAIKAGKHIFCEKPVALRSGDADKITAAAQAAGVSGQVGQCIRFWPEYRAFRAFVQSGKAGALRSFALQRRSMIPTHSVGDWLLDPVRSGGAALDLHIHDTDFIVALLGCPRSVAARGTKDDHGLSHIFTTYDYPGVCVTAEGGWNYPPKWGFQMAFQAVFDNGAVEYDSGTSPTLSVTIGGGPKKPLPFAQPSAGSSATGSGNISSLGGYFNELQYFIGCLERRTGPQEATLAQAAESLRVVLAEIASARAGGKPVKL